MLAFTMVFASAVGTAVAQGGYIGRASPYFSVQSESGKNRRGVTTVSGYIHNEYGLHAGNLEILIEGSDNQGQVTIKTVVPVLGSVPPFGRLYFEARTLGDAASYRVTVHWFEWIGRGSD